jgi:hypothetical protein
MNAGQPEPPAASSDLDRLAAALEDILTRGLRLTRAMARVRGLILIVSLMIFWTLFAFVRHPFRDFGTALIGLLVPAYLPRGAEPVAYFFGPIFNAYFSLDTLITLAAMFLPMYLALEFAAIYQKDIYELPSQSISRRFILQSAFSLPEYPVIRITAEKLTAQQQRSPINLIGGPGIVNPDLEYAVVFERPDGTPHFIRADMSRQERTLEGFERLRRIIDTRDHTFHYDKITGRTRDGIKISIQDVNLLFSIYRRSSQNPLNRPYPAYRRDVYWLTYQQPSEYWVNAMIALVQDYMLRFIQRNTFGALLAAVGEPEIRRQVELEARVQREGWIHPLRRPLTFIYTREMPFSPMQATHIPRPQLSNFFRSFTEGFPQAARQRGLRLEWINVGTWNTPEIVILEQHVEAWQLTNDNLARSNARVLEQLRSQAYNRELARLVQEYPLLDYARLLAAQTPSEDIQLRLLREYESRLRMERGRYFQNNQTVPPEIDQALAIITASLHELTARSSNFLA